MPFSKNFIIIIVLQKVYDFIMKSKWKPTLAHLKTSICPPSWKWRLTCSYDVISTFQTNAENPLRENRKSERPSKVSELHSWIHKCISSSFTRVNVFHLSLMKFQASVIPVYNLCIIKRYVYHLGKKCKNDKV